LGTVTLEKVLSHPVTRLLSEHHYSAVAKTLHTVFYKRMPRTGGR
jgi:hypothetical protein